jgi:hypothetical protein
MSEHASPIQGTFAARADRVERIGSGHSPFLPQLRELAAGLEHALLHEDWIS